MSTRTVSGGCEEVQYLHCTESQQQKAPLGCQSFFDSLPPSSIPLASWKMWNALPRPKAHLCRSLCLRPRVQFWVSLRPQMIGDLSEDKDPSRAM